MAIRTVCRLSAEAKTAVPLSHGVEDEGAAQVPQQHKNIGSHGDTAEEITGEGISQRVHQTLPSSVRRRRQSRRVQREVESVR